MGDSPRLETLRRRVLADPASVAFAALAEEYRRAARFDDAIETARAGLERHPAYATARVTLGRALFESGDIESARRELEQALAAAPENLAGLRALADLYRSSGASDRARELARRGAALAPQDREWRSLVDALEEERRAGPPNIIPFHPTSRAVPATSEAGPVEPVLSTPSADDVGEPQAKGARSESDSVQVTLGAEGVAADPTPFPAETLVPVGANGEPLDCVVAVPEAEGVGDPVADLPEAVAQVDEAPVTGPAEVGGPVGAFDVVVETDASGQDPIDLPLLQPADGPGDPPVAPTEFNVENPVLPRQVDLADLAATAFIEPEVTALPVTLTADDDPPSSPPVAVAPLERWLDAIVRERARRQNQ